MARRLSYASVVSGLTTTTSPPQFSPPTVSTAFPPSMNPVPGPPPAEFAAHSSSFPSRLTDSQQYFGIGQSLPDSWGRSALPTYSTSFGQWDDGRGEWKPRLNDFFVPSYLLNSRHMQRLEERHKARLAARKESKSHRSSNAGSLSTTPSSANLHKLVPSHRGMTHDIIERLPSADDDTAQPLPSRWSAADKFPGLDVYNDGSEVKFNGSTRTQDEAAAIRADHPIPRECGIYYFEVTVAGKGKDGLVGVGLSGPKVSLNRIPGWESDSWAYHSDDGSTFCQTATAKQYGPKFGQGDVVGCGINFSKNTCFFTRNGVYLGVAFKDIKTSVLYPSVGVKKLGEQIRANFGKEPFVFDIDNFVEQEKQLVRIEIGGHDISKLSARKEDFVLQQLVAQYLMHDGHMDTARIFAQEAQANARLLLGGEMSRADLEYKDDGNASNRQRIRTAILEGDMDKALKLTTAYYPEVLRDNESIYFKMKCRKFIEMIRKGTELQPTSRTKRGSLSNGHAFEDDIFNGQMELDQTNGHDGFEGMDIEVPDTQMMQMEYMKDALQYGQELQREFKDDPRREVKKALENTFALIAYPDARESSLAPLLEIDGRIPVAEELNSAILVSLGKSSTSALERMYQHTEAMTNMLSDEGGPAALLNLRNDYFKCD